MRRFTAVMVIYVVGISIVVASVALAGGGGGTYNYGDDSSPPPTPSSNYGYDSAPNNSPPGGTSTSCSELAQPGTTCSELGQACYACLTNTTCTTAGGESTIGDSPNGCFWCSTIGECLTTSSTYTSLLDASKSCNSTASWIGAPSDCSSFYGYYPG